MEYKILSFNFRIVEVCKPRKRNGKSSKVFKEVYSKGLHAVVVEHRKHRMHCVMNKVLPNAGLC